MVERVEKCIVTDRVFVLGLDGLYREDMRKQETHILLPCARAVLRALRLKPCEGPVEGYYSESPELAEYFRAVRALQPVDPVRLQEVRHMPAFQRLFTTCSARLFGSRQIEPGFLGTRRDSLSEALTAGPDSWNLNTLLREAARASVVYDDYSLAGLASRLQDAVCLTALRESVVLYAELVIMADDINDLLRDRIYEWDLSPELSENAARFIDDYNGLFQSHLPAARAENARAYDESYAGNDPACRCVRIGTDPLASPPRHYHWKIDTTRGGEYTACDFLSEEIWTTSSYRASMNARAN
jgi:hypothetical protein